MIFGLRWYGPVAILVFLASTLLMVLRVDPFHARYYLFAWYTYIVFADALIHRWRGRSLLSHRFGEFALMLPLSFLLWEMFEGFDLRLNNWYYARTVNGVVEPLAWSWWNAPVYFLAYATVLPGEFQTIELVRIGSERRWPGLAGATIRPWRMTRGKFYGFQLIGCLCIALPMIWPRVFFPLIWLSMIFIFDPINWRAGRPSLLRQLSRGQAALFCQILIAGMICGLFWEFWNFWAGTKWVYTVPWPLNVMKVFEMPVLGFFGFPPFALECYALYHFMRALPGVRRLAGGPSLFAYETLGEKERAW